MPPAFSEFRVRGTQRVPCGDIPHVGIADIRERVVDEHGVDGLRELGATSLVDTAGIVPDPAVSMRLGKDAAIFDFGRHVVARIPGYGVLLPQGPHVLKGLLLVIPYMR